jgi:hypothetical protein
VSFCGSTTQLEPRPPHGWGFYITHTHARARWNSSERVISSSQSPLPTQNTTSTITKIQALSGNRTRKPQQGSCLRTHGHRNRWSLRFLFQGATAARGPRPPHYRRFTITFRRNTLGRTPLDEWSARRRDLNLTRQDIHKRQTSMPPAGFEPIMPARVRKQAHASLYVILGNLQ